MEEASQLEILDHQNYIEVYGKLPSWSFRYPPPAAASPPSHFRINFTFSFESQFSEWLVSEGSEPPLILSEYSQPEADMSIVLDPDEFLNDRGCREIMALEFRDLPLTEAQREEVTRAALKWARSAVASVPPHHYVVDVALRVHIMHKYTMTRAPDSGMSQVMGELFDEAPAQKVPAAETAVEMVMREKVELDEMQTCTICLEEVREGVRMTCSHVFHGSCIGGWLRNDHRCPICRFQMPVAMESGN